MYRCACIHMQSYLGIEPWNSLDLRLNTFKFNPSAHHFGDLTHKLELAGANCLRTCHLPNHSNLFGTHFGCLCHLSCYQLILEPINDKYWDTTVCRYISLRLLNLGTPNVGNCPWKPQPVLFEVMLQYIWALVGWVRVGPRISSADCGECCGTACRSVTVRRMAEWWVPFSRWLSIWGHSVFPLEDFNFQRFLWRGSMNWKGKK